MNVIYNLFIVQFFTMHEILHTYHFLSLRQKNTFPSFHASWRNFLYITRISILLWWRIFKLRENILRSYKKVLCCLSNEATLLNSLRFSLFQNILRRSILYPLLVPHAICCMMLMLCKMMWWCYVMQNDICAEDTHIPAIEHTIFLYQRWLFTVSLP